MSSCMIIWLMIFTLGLVKQSFTLSTLKTELDDTSLSSVELDGDTSLQLDLDKAESKDASGTPPKLEIIKQIRRLNSDGSYTVGYEAEDGTFKIESRDVLGNVKGTYGYVDVNGEIKRVSYTANNSTVRGSTPRPNIETETKQPEEDDIVQIPRQNKTAFISSTTRRPASLSYLTTSQATPTRNSVIQAIPKKRILLTASSERPTYNHYPTLPRQNDYSTAAAPRKNGEPTTTVVYATSVPTNRPQLRPTPLPSAFKQQEQISRPDKLEITDHVSKVQISSNRDTSTSKPVTENVDESDITEKKPPLLLRGNFVRRQSAGDEHDEKFEAQQQVIYSQSAGDDSSHIYGGTTGTARPLFSTNAPRLPSVVIAARSRAAQLQNAINAQQKTNDKVYVKPPRRRPESREDTEQTTESTSENQYITQRPIPVVQIGGPNTQQAATEEDKRVYRRPVSYVPPHHPQQQHRNREFIRQAPPADYDYGGPRQFRIPIPAAYPHPAFPRGAYAEQPIPPSTVDESEQQQYLRETSTKMARPPAGAPPPYPAGNEPGSEFAYQPRGRGRQYLPLPQQQLQQQQQPRPAESGYPQMPYGPPNPYSPYNRQQLPSEFYQHPDRPLTARDFERLLNLLVVRHQQLQRYNPVNPYLFGGGYNNFGQFGYQQIPRPPIYGPYDPRYAGYGRDPPPYGDYSSDGGYQASTAPANDQQAAYAGNPLIEQRKQRPYRGQYYGGPQNSAYHERPEYSEASQPIAAQQDQIEYLPPDIREELLYRMLLLAMQPGESAQGSNPEESSTAEYSSASKTTTTSTTKPVSAGKYRKPVRSVQILGEE